MCGRFTLRTPARELADLFDPLDFPVPDGSGGSEVETRTLITGEPHDLVRPVHDRMPAIRPPERHDLWLDPASRAASNCSRCSCPTPPGRWRRTPSNQW